jgi:predicted phage-related endonuclease
MMIERLTFASREEWLALRKGDVTASTVAALFGLHPYETALGLYAAKTGVAMPDIDSKVLRRGRLLEGAVAEAVREERPWWAIAKANEYLRDAKIRLGATPDFYVYDENNRRGVLQTKTVAPNAFRSSWTEETPPTHVALQTATEMMLDNADFGVIAALVVDGWNFDLHLYDVPRNAGAEARIREAVTKFWDDVAAGRPPKTDYARDDRLMQIIYPRQVPGKEIDLRGDNRALELLAQREAAMEQIKIAEAAKAEAETELREKIGDAEIAIVRGWKVSLKEIVVREHVRKASSSRRFFISRDQEDGRG